MTQVTDTYGDPDLVADHSAPVCSRNPDTVDAMDFYSTWKLFDALTDYAFYGINEEYCLGNTSEQRFMGLWSDGTPVNELKVTDNPVGEGVSVPVYNSKNIQQKSRIVSNLFYKGLFDSFPNVFPLLQKLIQQHWFGLL